MSFFGVCLGEEVVSREGAKARRTARGVSAFVVALLASSSALAEVPAALAYTQLPDARAEAAARGLMAEVRCLVCEGQSIADSDAEMAADMRAMIRARVAAGEEPGAIRAWLIERYGSSISYDPPLTIATAPLWIAPVLLVGAGIWFARRRFRKR